MSCRFELEPVLLSMIFLALISLPGCLTLEERWQQFDMERRQEIRVTTKDYYLSEWGKPAKRVKSDDGGEVWTEELRVGKRR